ncbi:hypothetical protein EDC04DRAFT_2899734 [Pisolithus marmoratus]|nr:hypothetical protein EDC04DRAFT_2899734 [Pisolithus marmoratus]
MSTAQSCDASCETGTTNHPWLAPAAEQLPDQGDGLPNGNGPGSVFNDNGPGEFCNDNEPGNVHNDDGPEDVFNDNGPREFHNDNGPSDVSNDNGPGDVHNDDDHSDVFNDNSPGESCNDNNQSAEHNDDCPPAPPAHSPPLDLDIEELICKACLPKLQCSLHFVCNIRNASLDDGMGLTGKQLVYLCNPPKEPLQIEDPSIELALLMFIVLEHSSESTYAKIQQAIQKSFPIPNSPHSTKPNNTLPISVESHPSQRTCVLIPVLPL